MKVYKIRSTADRVMTYNLEISGTTKEVDSVCSCNTTKSVCGFNLQSGFAFYVLKFASFILVSFADKIVFIFILLFSSFLFISLWICIWGFVLVGWRWSLAKFSE